MNVQAKVAIEKREHPERFCPTPRCLWRTAKLNHSTGKREGGGYCPRHGGTKMEATLEKNRGPMTPAAIVSDLTYSSYAFNRRNTPSITPEQWERVFGTSALAMEERFQQELHAERLAGDILTPETPSPSQPTGSVITKADLRRDSARVADLDRASGCNDW